ncbi:MAG: prolyl oligopeptidase family serine peptidase, partial [Planctomycetaceae bacterium]
MPRLVAFGLIATACLSVSAADIPDAERTKLEARTKALQDQLAPLLVSGKSLESLADVAVCAKAAEWIRRHDEFHKPDYVAKTSQVLDLGEARAKAMQGGKADWATQPGGVALGYVSRVDGSVQPYALTLPDGYDAGDSKRWPLYVVLHGRNGTMTEATFIAGFEGKKPTSRDYVQLDVYGRGNNAFRWAGETDVFEAIADVRKRVRIDDRRIVLWGFSMGGAGAWHLGLHHPDQWVAAGAGAGFVDLYGYTNRKDKLPPHQDATLSIYDSVNYAMNAANVPFVTYGGDQDKQLLASTTMLEAADPLGVEIEFILGKNIGHDFTPEAEKAFQAFLAEHAEAGRPLPSARKNIRFTTPTTKYNRCGWVTIEELAEQYDAAVVEAAIADDGATAVVTTENVAALRLSRDVAEIAEIDGDRLALRDAGDGLLPDAYYLRSGDGWRLLNYDESREFASNPDLRKRHGLQGPIDDAFTSSFVVVKGDKAPWSASHRKYADWSLARFEKEWD